MIVAVRGFLRVAPLRRYRRLDRRRIRLAVLGRLPGNRRSVDLADHPDATTTPGLLLVRPDGPVFFANATHSG